MKRLGNFLFGFMLLPVLIGVMYGVCALIAHFGQGVFLVCVLLLASVASGILTMESGE